MEISTLLKTRTYDAEVSIEQLARDVNYIEGLREKAAWRPRIYLALALLFPLLVLAYVIPTVDHTSEADMPYYVGIPVAVALMIEVNLWKKFSRWLDARFEDRRRYLFPLMLLRSLKLEPGSLVKVKSALSRVVSATITPPSLQIEAQLPKGVRLRVEIEHRSKSELTEDRKRKNISSWFVMNTTLSSAPGAFPQLEALKDTAAQKALQGKIYVEASTNVPGKFTIAVKPPYDWTEEKLTLLAAALIQSMHSLLEPGLEVVDFSVAQQAPKLQPELPAGFVGDAKKPLIAGAVLLPLSFAAAGIFLSAKSQSNTIYENSYHDYYEKHTQLKEEVNKREEYVPGLTPEQEETKHREWKKKQDEALRRLDVLERQHYASEQQLTESDTTRKRALLATPVFFLAGAISLVVGLLRRRKPV